MLEVKFHHYYSFSNKREGKFIEIDIVKDRVCLERKVNPNPNPNSNFY